VSRRAVALAPAVEPEKLAVSHLAHFVGLCANRRLVGELERAGFGDLREAHGFLIQHLLGGPRSVGELARLLGVSQQAVSKTVAELTAAGYLESMPAADARVRLVQLSTRGERSVEAARRLRGKLERELAKRLGTRRFEQARRLLVELLDELGGSEAVKARRVQSGDAL
jgi:DNA-binding MarR family transcriptional regulator